MSDQVYHVPVLLNEVIDALQVKKDGVYVDCTFGGGGHARALLAKLGPKGKLIAFDQDEATKKNLPEDERLIFVSHNFRHLQRFLKLEGFTTVDGMMADLGVSSHQFDEAERGFSTRFDADLDMRMDQRQSLTAFDIVQNYTEKQLHKLLEQYGEVTNAKTVAKTIVQVRHNQSLKTINGFKNALREIVKGNPKKYFAQVFQALRIEVNDEISVLKELLEQIPPLLNPGGRAAIITFHSLEDRWVKNFFKHGYWPTTDTNPFTPTEKKDLLKMITKKPVLPTATEMKKNARARSAKLRVAEKIE
ncbi:MAG: 16S rRNA (cytosine(1402)-N(4))-methyltransferase RsmH [Chitinophagaceae bacterium]|nr:16S rRNA (cytosine(1402)-N(4))-methyltransferase RsmH [Chitinophagaceae bacterium]MCB0740478.1 16S rRNA (cytosine(1402)-N(4))-methyltransferase RsmH [Chitinophagaceae bacterium]